MKIKLEALDTLFFKDGKPFSMGDESWADGIFPPPPSVIYGALRSAYFGENPGEIEKAGSVDDPTNKLEIKGIYLSKNDKIFFPLPLDCVKKKNFNDNKVYIMTQKDQTGISNCSINTTLFFNSKISNSNSNEDEIEFIESGILRESAFLEYLTLKEKEFDAEELSSYVLPEPKVGIGRQNFTRTTEESKLYRVGMKRLESSKEFNKESNRISMVVEFKNLNLKDNGYIKFGAEGKIAEYKLINFSDDMKKIQNPDFIKGNIFKVYLLTPAIFENGSMPDLSNNEVLKELKLELVTASIGKPISIGGFDMKKRTPKPMRKAVPAGSVYYLKSKNCISEFISNINGISISEYNSKEGFGICIVGGVGD